MQILGNDSQEQHDSGRWKTVVQLYVGMKGLPAKVKENKFIGWEK